MNTFTAKSTPKLTLSEKQIIINNHISTATALLFPEQKLAIFYTEKAGATSLINWYHFQHDLTRFQLNPNIRNNANNAELMIAHQSSRSYQIALSDLRKSILNESPEPWTTVKFVRDPYRRAISAFFMVMLLKDAELSAREFFNLPKSYFTHFGDGHCRPQTTELERTGILRPDHIFKLEDGLNSALMELEKKFNLKDSYQKVNSHANRRQYTQHGQNNSSPADKVITSREIREGIQIPPIESYLKDKLLLAAIHDKYEEDFLQYQYPVLISQEEINEYQANNLIARTERMDGFYDPGVPHRVKEQPTEAVETTGSIEELLSIISREEKIVLYGAGETTFELLFHSKILSRNIVAIADKSPDTRSRWKLFFSETLNIPIVSPTELLNIEFDRIVNTVRGCPGEAEELLEMLYIPRSKIIRTPKDP